MAHHLAALRAPSPESNQGCAQLPGLASAASPRPVLTPLGFARAETSHHRSGRHAAGPWGRAHRAALGDTASALAWARSAPPETAPTPPRSSLRSESTAPA